MLIWQNPDREEAYENNAEAVRTTSLCLSADMIKL